MIKKTALFLVLLAACASAPALNFFGIEHNGNTADNVVNILYGLAQGDQDVVREYSAQLEKTDASLARKVEAAELTVPCAYCGGTGTLDDEKPCPACEGTGGVTDPQSMVFIQRRFCAALDAGQNENRAWREAVAAFEARRERVSEREMLAGTVVRKEEGRALLTLPESGETVCLKGIGPEFPGEGSQVSGEVWPDGFCTVENEEGEPVDTPCYTVTLWLD